MPAYLVQPKLLPELAAEQNARATKRGISDWWKPEWAAGIGDMITVLTEHEGQRWVGIGRWNGYSTAQHEQKRDNEGVAHSRLAILATGLLWPDEKDGGHRYVTRIDGRQLLIAARHGTPQMDGFGRPYHLLCALTTPAVHCRSWTLDMPVLLDDERAAAWLDQRRGKAEVEGFLMPGSDGGLRSHRVADITHKVRVDGIGREPGPDIITSQEAPRVQPF